jgi:hypothetical protein
LIGVPAPRTGAADYVLLPKGRFAAVLSYTSSDRPFRLFTGSQGQPPTEAALPWACSASPADIESVGAAVWGHCLDPEAPENKLSVHFWHSPDGGVTWSRAGALPDAIALGRYAVSESRLLLATSKGKSPLLVREHAAGAWKETKAALAKGDGAWPKAALAAVVASSDGHHVALIGQEQGAASQQILLRASRDGAATFSKTRRLAWGGGRVDPVHTVIEDGVLYVLAPPAESAPVIVAKLSLNDEQATPEVKQLPFDPTTTCAWGPRVFGKRAQDEWVMSSDTGVSFVSVPAPPDYESGPAFAQCTRRGVRVGAHFHAWPG